jgi:CRISPR/Cas system-associated protein Cas7 (RAMP superfamily)
MIGCLIGVVKGRRNKLPNTSDQETENYVTNVNDETTEAIVTIEDELDADLYTDPGENDKDQSHFI